ncbi:MAG: shikimate dehydrogenase [Pseudomonadota bacterium]
MMRAGVVGWPVKHSKSPIIHGHWIAEFDLDAKYTAISLEPDQFEMGIQKLVKDGYRGCNVTIPHKEAAFQLADTISPRAEAIGAVNTLVFRDNLIYGDNTDGIGFLNNILSVFPQWDASKGPAAVIGAGGAARAIIWALKEANCPEIRIWNRTIERAASLAEDFGSTVKAIENAPEEACDQALFLVNTSALGMVGQPELRLDISSLDPSAIVTDIVYSPLETQLLQTARVKGHGVVDGFGMLLHQAVPGFEAWFGVRPTVTKALRAKVLA